MDQSQCWVGHGAVGEDLRGLLHGTIGLQGPAGRRDLGPDRKSLASQPLEVFHQQVLAGLDTPSSGFDLPWMSTSTSLRTPAMGTTDFDLVAQFQPQEKM